jgi:hypothetical protein
MRELTKDKISFYRAVRVLSSYRLMEADMFSQGLIESRGYSIHAGSATIPEVSIRYRYAIGISQYR